MRFLELEVKVILILFYGGKLFGKNVFKILIFFEIYLYILDGSCWYSLCGIFEKEKKMF